MNKYYIGVGREKNFSIGIGQKDRPPGIKIVWVMDVKVDHFLDHEEKFLFK